MNESSCSLAEGGAPPRFLIIDDGWQQIAAVPQTSSRRWCRIQVHPPAAPAMRVYRGLQNLPIDLGILQEEEGSEPLRKRKG